MRTIQYGLVNSTTGQIPCSTERISCCFYIFLEAVQAGARPINSPVFKFGQQFVVPSVGLSLVHTGSGVSTKRNAAHVVRWRRNHSWVRSTRHKWAENKAVKRIYLLVGEVAPETVLTTEQTASEHPTIRKQCRAVTGAASDVVGNWTLRLLDTSPTDCPFAYKTAGIKSDV